MAVHNIPSPIDEMDTPLRNHRLWDGVQRVLSVAMLILLTPVFVLIAIAIKLDSKGPVIYSQMRPGYLGRPFRIYKFRTMTTGSDRNTSNALAVTKHSAEVTRVGRLLRKVKIDELPQLYNIVRGEMTFVGPRPIATALHDMLMQNIEGFGRRYLVKPGLTNVAQVTILENLPPEMVLEDWHTRFEAEFHYVQQKSVFYDLIVIVLTILFILRKALRQEKTE